jgi:putative ABC transport system permease protein
VLLVVPVAVALATFAGLPPAWRASRGSPLDVVNPPPVGRTRARPVRGLPAMALRNLGRAPGRALLGAAGLTIGVAALTVLLAINLAFQGIVAGTVLGDFLAAQVRTVDYASVALAIALGAAGVADVLFLNLRERAAELVALRAAGWRDRHLHRLVGLEGAAIGLAGSGLGVVVGLTIASQLGQADVRDLANAALGAGLAGIVAASLLVVGTVRLLTKLPPPTVLGEE